MKKLALVLYDLLGAWRSRLWHTANPPQKPHYWWEKAYWYEVTAYDKDGNPVQFVEEEQS